MSKTKPKIIVISGTGPGAGKTTFANELCRVLPRAFPCSFASPLKYICTKFFGWDGKKDEKGRTLLQEIGCAARHYDPNIWANKALKVVAEASVNPSYLVFDDARFPNEADVFRAAGYEVIQFHISRYFDEPPHGIMHESEGYIPNPPFILVESAEIEAFKATARRLAKELL